MLKPMIIHLTLDHTLRLVLALLDADQTDQAMGLVRELVELLDNERRSTTEGSPNPAPDQSGG